MAALTYKEWRNFSGAIQAAMKACEGSSYPVSDHFVEANKMVPLGKGAHREIEDYHLSRYACYLLVMNGDASKPVVALGQTYFAVQTERARLADATAPTRHLLLFPQRLELPPECIYGAVQVE